MKLYGWVRHLYRDEPVSHEERMRLKRRERFRAANDVASGVGYVGGEYWLDWDDPPTCDETCEICHGADAVMVDGFALPPLTHTLSEAA